MKSIKHISLGLIFAISLVMTSCANAEKAKPAATKFYELMQKKDYTEIEKMLSESMIKQSSVSGIINFIAQKEELGALISFEPEGEGKVMEIDNKQVVRFLYTVKYTTAELHEYLRLVLVGEEYKIDSYGYFDTKEKRDEFMQHAE